MEAVPLDNLPDTRVAAALELLRIVADHGPLFYRRATTPTLQAIRDLLAAGLIAAAAVEPHGWLVGTKQQARDAAERGRQADGENKNDD